MSVTTYAWRPAARFAGDAQIVGEALETIERSSNGALTPHGVVENAVDDNSPLHPYFEWDNVAAAEAYRVEQARELIASVFVRVSRPDTEVSAMRAFVNVRVEDENRYVSTFTALSSIDLRKQVIARAWSELEAWRKRHAELSELGQIFSAMDEARPLH